MVGFGVSTARFTECKLQPTELQQISSVLKIPVEAFQNFDEEQAVNVIANTFNDNAIGVILHNNNPIDRLMQLHDDKIALYERMLKEKDEMMVRLERLIEKG